jgi:hypothetical protein
MLEIAVRFLPVELAEFGFAPRYPKRGGDRFDNPLSTCRILQEGGASGTWNLRIRRLTALHSKS